MSNEKKAIPPLQTITANALMNTDYPPLAFSIEKLLPQGIFILAESGKIGKSWLSLDMAKRQRDMQLHFMVSPKERSIINEKMASVGTKNRGAYFRKMAVDGLIIHLDIADVRELVRVLRVTSNSLNQLTKCVYETVNT